MWCPIKSEGFYRVNTAAAEVGQFFFFLFLFSARTVGNRMRFSLERLLLKCNYTFIPGFEMRSGAPLCPQSLKYADSRTELKTKEPQRHAEWDND